jgi:arginase
MAHRSDPQSSRFRTLRVIGVPLDLGASRRGVDMGPSALRIAGLGAALSALGYRVEDLGNVAVPQRETLRVDRVDLPELRAITAVCRELAAMTAETVRHGGFPLVLGGDHSLAAGSVAGVATALAEREQRLGLIWLDAHADINTPQTSATGNVHGMPVAHLLGHGDADFSSLSSRRPAIRTEDVAMIGLRDLDPPEQDAIRRLGIAAYTTRDIDERGLHAVMREAIERVSQGTAGIHVSCDADWVDPSEAPGVGTPVRGGATYREAHLAMEMLSDTGRIISMDFVELNPTLDRHNTTALLGVELIASALGKRTL